MILIKISTLLVVFVLEYSLAAANLSSELTLTYEDGNTITYTSAQPRLSTSKITIVCYQGAWAAYSDRNFALESFMMLFPPVEKRCFIYNDSFYHQVLSARPIGDLSNITAPSITFYTEKDFGGVEMLVTTEVPYIDFDIKSFVALNGVSVEYFTKPNFTGKSICVHPLDSTGSVCHKGNCNVSDLETIEVGILIANATSLRVTNCSNRKNKVELE